MKVQTINKDVLVNDLESGYTIEGRNIVLSDKHRSATNEDGFSVYYTHNKLIYGFIDTNKEIVIFSGTGVDSEIGVVRDGVYTCTLIDFYIDIKANVPIDGTYIYNSLGELIIIWWNGVKEESNKPKILNIDCLPFIVDSNCRLIRSSDSVILDLQQDIPTGDLTVDVKNNGSIECGAYFISYAYFLLEGGTSNYTHPSNPIFVHDDNSNLNFEFVDGCEGGDIVDKRIEIAISTLNPVYKKIRIAVIKKINEITTAFHLGDFNIVNQEVRTVYSDSVGVTTMALEEILIDSPIYDKMETGVFLDSKFYMGNVRIKEKPEIQQYVNNIDVTWVLSDGGNLASFEDSSKDSAFTFVNRSFKSGETYALYFVAKVKNRGLVAYHIPNKLYNRFVTIGGTVFSHDIKLSTVKATIAPTIDPNVEQGLLVDPDMRIFHIYNTATSGGNMGIWENENERYPSVNCWDIYNAAGGVIGNLQNRKVSHHTFPSWRQLFEWDANDNIYDAVDVTKLTSIASAVWDSDVDGSFTGTLSMPTITALTGGWVAGNKFTATEDMTFYLRVMYVAVNAPSDTSPNFVILITKRLGGEVLDWVHNDNTFDGSSFVYNELHFEIELKEGEELFFNFSTTETVEGRIEVQFINKKLDDVNITNKRLGIQVSNVNIPNEIKNEIEEWYIGFAERTNENITRLGQSVMIPNNRKIVEYESLVDGDVIAAKPNNYISEGYKEDSTTEFRTHNFDQLYFQSNINIDFVLSNLRLGGGVYDYHNLIDPYSLRPFTVKAVKSAEIIPENNSVKDNKIGEEFIKIELYDKTDFGNAKYEFEQVDLGFFKSNIYLNFTNQNVILMSSKYPSSATISNPIFSGDTFINLYGIGVSHIGDKGPGNQSHYLAGIPATNVFQSNKLIDNLLYVTESIANIGLRHLDSTNEDTKYFPKRVNTSTSFLYKTTKTVGSGVTQEIYELPHLSEGKKYNTDFNALNNLNGAKEIDFFICAEDCITDVTKFYKRIVKSPGVNDESLTYQWRRFRTNDYYEGLPTNRGGIISLKKLNRSLMIQMNEALYVAVPKDVLQTDTLQAYLGSGDLFDRLPEEIVSDDDGYIGCLNKWSTGVCKHGYYVWDGLQGKIFIFDGKINEISNQGMHDYFEENSRYDNIKTEDNPFAGDSLIIGFDQKENRLLVTKKIIGSFNEVTLESETWSYSFDYKGWVCRHDYKPFVYIFNREGLFSINNTIGNTTGKIFKHNDNLPCIFYNGSRSASFIDIVINSQDSIDVLWESIQWVSEARNSINPIYNDTITHIAIYTNHHNTGLIKLIKLENLFQELDNSRKKGYFWSFNDLRDKIADKDSTSIDIYGNIDNSNINSNIPWFDKNYIINPFIVVRLYMDHTVSNKIHISEIFANTTKL